MGFFRGRKVKKWHCRIFIVLSLAFLCFTGCSSTGSVSMAIKTGYPIWYYNPQVTLASSKTGFSGLGKGSTMRQAELLAYTQITDNICSYLDNRVSQEDIREFLTYGTIEKFGLVTEDSKYSRWNGTFTAVFRVSADTEKLDMYKSDAAKERDRIINEIQKLVEQGDEYIMTSRDIDGVSCYIKSLVLSYGAQDVPEDCCFDEIYNEILEILSGTKISVRKPDPLSMTCSVKVRRKESVFYENIANCPVKATYPASDSSGKPYMDAIVCDSDDNGNIFFRTLNKEIERNGSVVFMFDLEREIKALERVNAESARKIADMVESKKAVFDYSKSFQVPALSVCVSRYKSGAVFSESEIYSDYLCNLFTEEGIETVPYFTYTDMSDETLLEKAGAPLLSVRINPVESMQSQHGVCAVTVEGTALLYDRDENVIYDMGLLYSTGMKSDYGLAEKDACARLCKIICSRMKTLYVQ